MLQSKKTNAKTTINEKQLKMENVETQNFVIKNTTNAKLITNTRCAPEKLRIDNSIQMQNLKHQ